MVVPAGSELPLSSDIGGNLRFRYDWTTSSDTDWYAHLGINYRGSNVSAITGTAEFYDDNLRLQAGSTSGLSIQNEGGTFGTVEIDDGAGGTRLPNNSRFVNPSATTVGASIGFRKDNWGVELFGRNLTNEEAEVAQVVGKFTPEVSVQRPMTIGLRFSFDYE